MQRNIKVLVVEPLKEPRVEVIHNRLSDKQHIVGGLIQYFYNDDSHVVFVCNESGKILNLPPNRVVGKDVVAGTFFIAGDNDTGEDRSLTDEQIEKYKAIFGKESYLEEDYYSSEFDHDYDLYI